MNKKIFLTTLAIAILSFGANAFAECNLDDIAKTKCKDVKECKCKKDCECKKNEHVNDIFDENCDNHPCFKPVFHPSKAEMDKKRAEIDKRLKLTKEQKKKLEANRQQGHDKVKPIFEEKQKKLEEIKTLKEDIKKLNEQANAYREENMKFFESILTEKQLKEFNKIKEEQKNEMEKRRAEFHKKHGVPKHCKHAERTENSD